MKRVGVAIVGLGMAADHFAQALVELAPVADVRWAAARSEASTGEFASKYPFPTTTDIEVAITDPTVDAVFVLTPTANHAESGLRALAAGKHLLLEKPLALNSTDGAALVDAAQRAGLSLGVCFQRRFRPAVKHVAEIISSGTLGKVEAAIVSVPWWREQAYYDVPGRGTFSRDGGGALMIQGIHTLDLFRHLVGVNEVVAAQAATTGVHSLEAEDFISALARTGNGAPATIIATTALFPGRPDQIDIVMTGGTISIVGDNDLFFHGIDPARNLPVPRNEQRPRHANHRDLIAEFLVAVQEGRAPAVSGREALDTQLLVEKIYQKAGLSYWK